MSQFSHKITTSFIAFALGGLALTACQESGSRQDTATARRAEARRQAADTSEVEPEVAYSPSPNEFIEWKTATINGTQPLVGKTAALYRLLGQPDSIVSPNMDDICVSFYDKEFKYAYFKNSLLEVYGDTAVIGTLDFRHNPKLSLHTPTMRLGQATTLEDLAKEFPQAVKDQHTINVQDLGELTAVELPTGKTASDDGWILFFDKGKLVRIDYWMPC
ncbi:hypothetical protein [Hymenobacter wooponensis]|uniref:Lipoprotein n=1 Tax=Hymenobacter wooponensis TaxID=1525360 RepID=A0A4Z0MTZ0_9BACT|nr:hypothetical protein [Hymenobacter wooponensis]TGD82910.1 hypothetical protein EU557_03790 [Hymenobacter wooponensis]